MKHIWRTTTTIQKNLFRITWLVGLSLVIISVDFVGSSIAATDTGGYPWATANIVSMSTYDWGFTVCQPAMRLTNTCSAHIKTKTGVKYYESDPWRYDVRNCTSYVAWRVHSDFGVSIPGWGNAKNWAENARKAGFRVDTIPQVGSIAQWTNNYGHVAFVTAVNPDGSVNVEQYNKAGTGEFSRQSRVRAVNYLHVEPAVLPVSTPAPVPAIMPVTALVVPESNPVQAVQTISDQKQVEELKPLTPEIMLSSESKDFEYIPVLDPQTHQVNVYAIHSANTNSTKIEVSKSSGKDGNSSWEQTWITEQAAIQTDDAKFVIADYDSDGVLDLYTIAQSNAESHNMNVTILNGSTGFKKIMGDWQTKITATTKSPSSYSVADYDGDGSLDIFKVDQNSTDNVTQVTVLDGAKKFAEAVGTWTTPSLVTSDATTRFEVSDHDRDGKVDVYQVTTLPKVSVPNKVTVLDATSNFQKTLCTWRPEQPSEIQS